MHIPYLLHYCLGIAISFIVVASCISLNEHSTTERHRNASVYSSTMCRLRNNCTTMKLDVSFVKEDEKVKEVLAFQV